jgi:ParB family chromosome partitioning protein
MPPENLTIVGIDTDHKSMKDHHLYDPRIKLPVNEEDVLNILEYGVLEPVLVTKEDDKVIVVDGRQRVRAAREANKRLKKQKEPQILVDLVVKRGDEGRLFGISIAGNVRKDDGILEKAAKAQALLDRGYPEEDIAVAFAVSKTAVKQWLSLIECAPEVRKLVEDGKISASAAVKLSKLDKAEQKEQAAEMVKTGKTTAADAQARTKTKSAKKNGQQVEDDGFVLKAPSKRIVRKLVLGVQRDGEEAVIFDGDEQRIKDFLAGVRWVMGDLNPASIKGLNATLKEL